MSMPFYTAASCKHACHKIVHPEANIHDKTKAKASRCGKRQAHRMAISLIKRQDKANWLHKIRSVSQQRTTFYQSFMHQGKVKIRKVANASVDELGRFAACAAGKVYFLDERNLVTTGNSVQRHTGTCDSTANYKYIKLFASQKGKVVHAHRC